MQQTRYIIDPSVMPRIPSYCSPDLANLIRRLLKKNEPERIRFGMHID